MARGASRRVGTGLKPTDRLSRYRVGELLGEGRYAQVYRGHDPILGRAVALRYCGPGCSAMTSRKNGFWARPSPCAALHPRIVPIYDAGCDADRYFIAMGLIEGESLAALRRRGAFQPGVRRAVEIVADLAEALAYIHRHGIVHRDVKPLNIQIDRAGQVYLLDFGIACQSESACVWVDGDRRTGTPAYVAPELARGDHRVILPPSDQYSLGVVFYELLCGRTPFVGPPLYVLYQAANQDPPSPRSVNPAISPVLAEICLKMLSRFPDNRYLSCDEVAGAPVLEQGHERRT